MPESPISLLDLTAQYGPLRAEIEAAITRVCATQQFVLGTEVEALEAEIAQYCGSGHGIGVSSGTDALLLALMTLGVGPGDEIITSPFTFFATGGVIARLGARPVFCDIEPQSFNLDPGAVAAFLDAYCDRDGERIVNRATGGTVAGLMPVHLYGRLADMQALLELSARWGLEVIEDAAQAIGAESRDGRRAGSFGTIGCLSFFPTKNLGAFGDAGMCVCNDPALAERMRVLRVHGGAPKYYHALIGGNFRLDALQAAVLRIKLRALDAWTEQRAANAALYDRLFAAAGLDDIIALPAHGDGRHTFNQYVIRTRDRDALRQWLAERRIGTEVYYPLSLHQQACFAYLGYTDAELPQAARAAAEVLALPIYPELGETRQRRVVAAIRAFFEDL
ncbi:MAG TPA: DegT/DnrJ/EryC1/StrS family aminotransferase [Gammaproteobacteria bacterium]|nr:DegT/DnrJ/EryC1/StrS family aminotransferase [Gammaproteobacteria bacterium]